jgi:hypothetical protein
MRTPGGREKRVMGETKVRITWGLSLVMYTDFWAKHSDSWAPETIAE